MESKELERLQKKYEHSYHNCLGIIQGNLTKGMRRVDGKHPTTAYLVWNNHEEKLWRIGMNGTHNRVATILFSSRQTEWFTFTVPPYKQIRQSK